MGLTKEQGARIERMRDSGLLYDAIAKVEGLSVDKVRRYLHAKGKQGRIAESARNGGVKLGGTPHDRVIVGLRDELARAKRSLEAAHRRALDEDAVRELIGTLAHAPVNPPDWTVKVSPKRHGRATAEVPTTSWSDWHAAETVSLEQVNGVNEFNIEIMERRVRSLVTRTIKLAKEHGPGNYPGIIVNLLGDFVSGGLHPELLKTDEECVLPAVLRVRDLMLWGLREFADHFGKVYAPAVCGNHGRSTTKPEFKDYVYKNHDWLIYQMLIRALKDLKDDRIIIDWRPSNEVHYRAYGMRCLSMHGDMMGVKGGDGIIGAIGPIMRGETKVRGWASSVGLEYDHVDIGHWHQSLFLPRVTVSNTLKGYCEFAKNALRAPVSDPSQPLRFTHPRFGVTSRWEIKVEDVAVDARAEKPWVAVFDKGSAA